MGRTTALLDGPFTACVVSSPKNTDSQQNHRYTRGNDRPTDSDSCRIISRRRTPPNRQHPRIWPERGRTDQYDSCFHFVLAGRHPSLLRCGSLKHERKRRRALNRLWSSISIRLSPERGAAQISGPVPSPSSQSGRLRVDDGEAHDLTLETIDKQLQVRGFIDSPHYYLANFNSPS
jgi:hypothetical protein